MYAAHFEMKAIGENVCAAALSSLEKIALEYWECRACLLQ